MNYLAHAFLSFNEREILAGNMISDFVKGKTKFDYMPSIQKGIQLHRLIDTFTDNHPVTARAKSYFRPQYRLYSGAFTDVVYDHFLAIDNRQFKEFGGLKAFSLNVYKLLGENYSVYPARFQKMFLHMKTHDWLSNYGDREGIRKSFEGLVYRAIYLKESVIAFEIFNKWYDELRACYTDFFPELKEFALLSLTNLLAD